MGRPDRVESLHPASILRAGSQKGKCRQSNNTAPSAKGTENTTGVDSMGFGRE
ncbi:MAG: hypothetical protein V3R99_00115 [Thermoguttaceae bacterium]